MVLSPHRDDAAFSLGLSINGWLAAGHTISVLNCFTQSVYAPYSDVEALHTNDRLSFVTALRKREDLAWNKLAGSRLSFHDLDLLDAPLRLNCSLDEVLSVDLRPGDRAVARVEGAVAKLARKGKQNSLAIAVPLAVGGHIDHRVVRQAALNIPEITSLPLAFYEDLPYAAREGEADKLPGYATDAMPGFEATLAATEGAQQSEAVARRKRRIAECYDSQVDTDVVNDIVAFSARYGGIERLWSNAAWRDCGLAGSVEVRP